MDQFASHKTARPWWDDVAHLRTDDAPASARAPRTRTATSTHGLSATASARAATTSSRNATASARAAANGGRGRTASARVQADWFTDDAPAAGRRTKARHDPAKPARPRVRLVDVTPDHTFVRRAPQVRRNPGERPTVTITGRPDAALPPQPRALPERRARRTREGASSLVSSPDRLILWAVALGLLMILASIGTASAHAQTALTLLP